MKGGQLNYYTTKRKLFAVVTFVEHFRYYLYGQQFIVRTDHASLRWLRNFRNIDGLLTSWLSKLEKYDFTIVHRIGPQHGNADALSCIPHRKCPRGECPDCSSTVKKAYKISRKTRVDTDEWLEGWTTEDLLEWQRSDLVLKREISWLETPTQNPSGVSKYDRRAKVYLGQLENLYLNEQGILCRKWYPQSKGLMVQMISQVVAPREIRARILRSLHNSPTGAHLGRTKNLKIVSGTDFTGQDTSGCMSRFGVMRSLHSDQGREFESDLISEMCKLLQVRKTRTVPYNLKSDGMIERANRTVIQMLTTLVNEARNDWDDHLPYVMMAYRASVHESTGLIPNKLVLNHETNLPIDLMVGATPDTPVCPVQYVEWLREASEHTLEFVQRNLRANAERQKRLYDRKGGLPSFEVGDSVWRYNHPGSKLKFGKKLEGPYLDTARLNTLCYRIQKCQNSRSIVVHVDHLKLYEGPKPVASWLVPEAQDDPHEATQRVIGCNDDQDDNVDEAVNDPDLLQPQHNLSANDDKLPISIRVPTNILLSSKLKIQSYM